MKQQKALKTISGLKDSGLIESQQVESLQKVAEKFNVGITPEMIDLIGRADSQDPIAKQFLPDIQELAEQPTELADPIGDYNFEPVKGIVHRYSDRCLLKIANVCPVYCRFCFRKTMIGSHTRALSKVEIEAAVHYIEAHSEIWEVILTGGDPFILKPSKIATLLTRLDKIPHVEIVRFHTRMPIVKPECVTDELIAALKKCKVCYVMIHTNHPKEFTEKAQAACARLIDAGIPLLSQTVLLKDINDNEETLIALMRTLVRNRIKPYYLHHLDLVKGTSHFRVPIRKGQQLMKALQKISGLCQPTYVIDIPGGAGKMPIGPCYLKELAERDWQIEAADGKIHRYLES